MKYYYDETRDMQNNVDFASEELDYTMQIYNNFLIYGNKNFKPYYDNNFEYDLDELYYCNEEESIKYLSKLWNVEESEIATYQLKGCVQRDWNILYYIKNDMDNETLKWINTLYFNMGYVIYSEDNCSYYVDSLMNNDNIKKELDDPDAELIIGSIEDTKESNNMKKKGECKIMEYNYIENVKNDVKTAILDNYTLEEIRDAFKSLEARDELYEKAYDVLFVDDSVTGSASGSYTFSAYKAEEFLCHNLELLGEALEYFGESESDALSRGAEYCDVTIRCYLLGSAINEALDELEEEI